MSTFYLLPPRPLPARPFADFLGKLLPGLDLARVTWGELTDNVALLLGGRTDVYFVHREDLPDGPAAEALADGFGAELGDEVIEVPGTAAAAPRRWRLGG